jgi:hypothetical protein
VPFLRRLHDEGLTAYEAMYLESVGIPESELRKRPPWKRIAQLIARRVDDLRWLVEERLAEPESEADRWRQARADAELAAWEKQLGADFWDRPLAGPKSQTERLQTRLSEQRPDGFSLRAELQPGWQPKGFAGWRRGSERELEAERLRARAARIEAGEDPDAITPWAELRGRRRLTLL